MGYGGGWSNIWQLTRVALRPEEFLRMKRRPSRVQKSDSKRAATAASMQAPIAKYPTDYSSLVYQKSRPSTITVGGAAPDGKAPTLNGKHTSLHEAIDPERPTILNFGSCT